MWPFSACTTDDPSGYPANSAFSVQDRFLVHRCTRPLQTAGDLTEQQQTCDHDAHVFTGDVQPCDGEEPAVYMSCTSQNCLFHVLNLSVLNFRIFLFTYPGQCR